MQNRKLLYILPCFKTLNNVEETKHINKRFRYVVKFRRISRFPESIKFIRITISNGIENLVNFVPILKKI